MSIFNFYNLISFFGDLQSNVVERDVAAVVLDMAKDPAFWALPISGKRFPYSD